MLVSFPAEALSGVFTVLRAAGESVVLVAQTRGMQICQLHLDRWRSVDSSWCPQGGWQTKITLVGIFEVWGLGRFSPAWRTYCTLCPVTLEVWGKTRKVPTAHKQENSSEDIHRYKWHTQEMVIYRFKCMTFFLLTHFMVFSFCGL